MGLIDSKNIDFLQDYNYKTMTDLVNFVIC